MKKVGKGRVKGKGVTEGQGEGREGWWKVKEENMREEEGGRGRKRRQVTKTSDISLATLFYLHARVAG